MAKYEVLVDWNVTSHVVVEANSEDEADKLVEAKLDGGWVPSGPRDLFDPEVVYGLTELVEDE